MASLYKKRGKWHIDYWILGKRITKNTGINATTEKKKIALKIKKEIEYTLELDTDNLEKKNGLITLESAYHLCLEHRFNPIMVSQAHIDQFKTVIKRFIGVIDFNKPITDINDKYISKFIISIKPEVSNATMHTYLSYLKIFFNFLRDEQIIKDSPIIKSLIPKRIKKDIIPFDEDQLEIMLSEAKRRDLEFFLILKMLLLTGLRPTDLISLKIGDFNLKDKVIRIEIKKTENVLYFPIYKDLKSFIEEYLWERFDCDKDALLFEGMSVNALSLRFRRMKKHLKIRNNYLYTLKTFRKTFASKLASNGIPIYDVANLLGHNNIKTTMKYYTKIDADKLRERMNSIK